jgi:prophage regulatory protein
MQQRILRLPEVINRTGLSRSSIYLKISKNEFPSQINLGERMMGFLEGDINKWIDERIKASRPGEVQ